MHYESPREEKFNAVFSKGTFIMEPFYNDTTKQNKGSEALSRSKILFFHEISLFKETFEVYFFMEFHVRSCWWTQRNLKLLSSRLWQSMENGGWPESNMREDTDFCLKKQTNKKKLTLTSQYRNPVIILIIFNCTCVHWLTTTFVMSCSMSVL